MSEFNNVSVVQTANIYFDGKVTSRTVIFSNGTRKTLGIMLPGEYEFGTAEKEIMDIFSGSLEFQLPDSPWQSIQGEGQFEVPANCKFQVKVTEVTDYCCSYD